LPNWIAICFVWWVANILIALSWYCMSGWSYITSETLKHLFLSLTLCSQLQHSCSSCAQCPVPPHRLLWASASLASNNIFTCLIPRTNPNKLSQNNLLSWAGLIFLWNHWKPADLKQICLKALSSVRLGEI
jgi:hypothetical protein